MRSQARYCATLVLALSVLSVPAQLNKWLARDLNGVYVVDMSTPAPTVGPFIAGLGTGGTEDVNMMTDASNNMLFCTAVDAVNMISVFDATFNQMPNGFGLLGHTSTLQSAICPIPCHADQYFYLHLVTGVPPGGALYYSVVDMTLNGGLGDVTLKNIPVGTAFTEALAISHVLPNGCRWLFSSLQNGTSHDLVRCLISETGIGPPTVIASVSTVATAYNFNEIELTPDNTRLAMNVYTTSPLEPDIAMWDLDLNNGTVSNLQTFSVSNDPIIGLQFSPLANYLYYQANGNTDDMDFGRVELATGTAQLIDPFMGRYLTMVELAGNGRIYVGLNYNYNYMAEVADPDNPVLASIGYNHNAVYISATGQRPPLPNAIEGEPPGSATTPGFIDFSAYAVGGCDTYQFVDSTCLATWWEWDFGDGTTSNVQAPQHTFAPGTYDITLRVVACGDTLSLTRPAYITSTTVAPVAGMAFPDTVCAGQPVTFTNSSLGATGYTWDFGDGSGSALSDPAHSYAAAGTYIVELAASNSCMGDTIAAPIIVLGGAAAGFVIGGDTCQLEIQCFNTSAGGSSWSWDFGDGSTSTAFFPTHAYAAPGTYTITLISDPGTACSDTASATVSVSIGPVAAFTDSIGCGLQATFLDQSTGASSLYWLLGDGSTSTVSAFTHTYPVSGPFDVTLIATAADGCSDDTTMTLLLPPPVVAGAAWLSDPCDVLQSFADSSQNATSLLWDLGDGTTSTGSAVVHSYPAAGPYTVTLIADPGSPCADTMVFIITVGEHPVAVFTDSVGCAMNAFFTDQSQDAVLLDWDLGDGAGSTDDSFEHSYATAGSYVVQLLVASADGCLDSMSVMVEIPAIVDAAFVFAYDQCEQVFHFTNISQNATTFAWTFGDGGNSSATDPDHAFVLPGSYEVSLLAYNDIGCSDSASATIDAPTGDVPPGLFVPNCFTPNGDGANDVFLVSGLPQCFDPTLSIFNRWGELVFEREHVEPWDGKVDGTPAPDGVYVYLLTYRGNAQYGHVTLLR